MGVGVIIGLRVAVDVKGALPRCRDEVDARRTPRQAFLTRQRRQER